MVDSLGEGVVVGQPGWDAKLEVNKQAYINQLVASSAFTSAAERVLPPAQFVDALLAGRRRKQQLRPIARQQLTRSVEEDCPAAAAALRAISDSNSLRAAEFRPSFVLHAVLRLPASQSN